MVNVILGSGISGLIANNIVKTDIVFEKNSFSGGGFINSLGPKYIHGTKENILFFKRFTRIDIQKIIYKYFLNGSFTNAIKDTDIQTYNKNMGYHFSSSMNRGEKTNEGFFLTSLNFFKYSNIKYNCEVLNIDIEKKVVYYLKDLKYKKKKYDNLISTIECKSFLNLSKYKDFSIFKHLNSKAVMYVEAYVDSSDFIDCFFFYNLDSEYKFYRCTKKSENILVFEFIFEDIDYGKCIYSFCKIFNKNIIKLNYYYNKFGKVFSDNEEELNGLIDFYKNKNIYFLGRNSTYSHDRVQDIIKKADSIKHELKTSI
jgi:hypothetical protein